MLYGYLNSFSSQHYLLIYLLFIIGYDFYIQLNLKILKIKKLYKCFT